jgi:dynactin complex subunit
MVILYDLLKQFATGDKVKVRHSGRKGIIRYFGKTKFAEGIWAGMELEEPTGAHNGTVEGETYFVTADKHAAFVRREHIELEEHYAIAVDMLKDSGGAVGLEAFKTIMESARSQIMLDPLPSALE